MRSLVLASAVLFSGTALAVAATNPSMSLEQKKLAVGLRYTQSATDYDGTPLGDGETFDRKVFGIEASYGLSSRFTPFAYLGTIQDLRTDARSEHGSGRVIGLGLRGLISHQNKTQIIGYGMVARSEEEMKVGGPDGINMTISEETARVGVSTVYRHTKQVRPYAALELVIGEDASLDFQDEISNQPSTSESIERNQTFVAKAGVNLEVDKVLVQPEVALLGERSVSLGVATMF